MIESVPLNQIKHNPWQTRTDLDGSALAELAEDIRLHGLLQPPTGRRLDDGTVQLAFGHRRYAAFVLLEQQEQTPGGLWSRMPVEIQELTDRQMAEIAASENSQRDDISAIDKAKAIQRLISDFGMTQIEAGRLFRLNSQGAVSNLLRLLRLPEAIQDQIQHGLLPERLARMLISLAEVDARSCQKIANAIADAEPDTRDGVLYDELEAYVRKSGHHLHWTPWPAEWPPSPVPSGNTHIKEIPSCVGCRFNVRTDASGDERGCVRKQCYLLKEHAWAQAEAERISQKLGIALAGKNEKPTLIFDGAWNQQDFAKQAVASKHESLRLISTVKERHGGYALKDVLGSEHVHLGSIDIRALKKAITGMPKPKAPKRELSKYELDRKKQNAERNARARIVRVLIDKAAPSFAPLVPPVLHDLLFNRLAYDIGRSMGEAQTKWKAASERERSEIIMTAALKSYVELSSYSAPAIDKASQRIASLAKAAGVKLPPGWDEAPESPTKIKKPAAKKPAKKGKKR